MWQTILNYLQQSSTYKGLFTVLAAFGLIIPSDLSGAITALCLAIVGLINVIIDENKKA